MADPAPFRVGGALVGAGGVEGSVGVFLGDVPGEGVAVEDLPLVVPVDGIRVLTPGAVGVADEVEVLGDEAGDI